jgi:transposase-like protein
VNTEKRGQRRSRRSREEIERLVVDFEASGTRPSEYCRKHGLPASTLQRHLQRQRLGSVEVKSDELVAVAADGTDRNENRQDAYGLAVVLSSEWRIEVRPNFDPSTLERLVSSLERGSSGNSDGNH